MPFRLLAALWAVSLWAQTFPMEKGTYWTYSGTVESQSGKHPLTWKSEVLESVTRGAVKAALLLGHPRDLDWYEPETRRGCYLLISREEREFYLADLRSPCALPRGDFSKLMIADNMIMRLPLHPNEQFGADGPPREDRMYAWLALDQSKIHLTAVRGIPADRQFDAYQLTYRTNPDHHIVRYAAGVGLTEYSYSHHGTVSEVNVRLVELHTP